MSTTNYTWRKLTSHEREEVLAHRKTLGRPWHAPPHPKIAGSATFHLTAACFEHRPLIGFSLARMDEFSEALLEALAQSCSNVFSWCVLPNHYHALVEPAELRTAIQSLGRLHGRSAHRWNGEDAARGRQVFFRTTDRAMRSDGHFWASLNYIHHNPVHHGYVDRWDDWPWGSACSYLERVGRAEAARIWRGFPVHDYGKDWDDPAK